MQQASTAHTSNELAELEERRNVFRRHLNAWTEVRNLYIPLTSTEAHATTSSTESAASRLPESMPLGLPSTLIASLRQSCPFKLPQIEIRFCLSQAEDSLSELRRLLRITLTLRDYKSTQIGPSQHAGTCAHNLINCFKDKVFRCVERYRHSIYCSNANTPPSLGPLISVLLDSPCADP